MPDNSFLNFVFDQIVEENLGILGLLVFLMDIGIVVAMIFFFFGVEMFGF